MLRAGFYFRIECRELMTIRSFRPVWKCRKIANHAIDVFQREVLWIVQDRYPLRTTSLFFFLFLPLSLGGCSDQGDLGRHSPSLISTTTTASLNKVRRLLGEEEDYDLPFTAAEDALRSRARDMLAVRYAGLVSQTVPALHGDGFLRVAAIIEDLKVDRQRFAGFVQAARKVMQIDEARYERLAGLDALTARRQASVARKRRARNDELIRNGVRGMRERSLRYRQFMTRLPVEYPDVPLDELQAAFEEFHEDVVRFHAQIDRRAHRLLGTSSRRRAGASRSSRAPYK